MQSQVYAPAADELLLGNMTFDDSLLLQHHPIKLEFNVTPDFVTNNNRQQGGKNHVDIVALSRLGVEPHQATKSCVRCGCMTLLQSAATDALPAKLTWHGQWSKHCMCGGYWKKDGS